MDPITIILVIAACIGGLIILYALVGLIIFLVSIRKGYVYGKKLLREFDDEPDWKIQSRRRPL